MPRPDQPLASDPEPDLSSTEFDVICVGGGLGGLAAAMRADDLGMSVLVLESSDFVGGGGAYSGGLCWVPGRADDDPPDSTGAADDYLGYVQGARDGDGEFRRLLLASAREAVDYFTAAGVRLEVVPGNPDVYYPQAPGSTRSGRMLECAVEGSALREWRQRLMPSPHYRVGLRHREAFDEASSLTEIADLLAERQAEDFLTMGAGLAGAFVRAALVERSVPCLLGHRVTGLLSQGGRVSGVLAQGTGGPVTLTARRGVLMATGGYGWSPDAADLEGLPDFVEAGPPSICGDHMSLAESVGAGIVRGAGPQFSMGAHLTSHSLHPGSDEPLCVQLFDVMGMPHNLVVNQRGQRFGDESYYVGINEALARWDATAKRWENFPCHLILDDRFRRSYPLGHMAAGEPYPADVARAGSLEALAALVQIDGPALAETVERFNRHADRGEDPEFGRGTLPFVRRRYGDPSHHPNANLGALREPPFYAVPLRLLGTGMCTFGLQTDPHGRVLRRDGSAVDGLYATGNAVATTEFRAYVTGYANTRNMTMAYQSVNAMKTDPPQRHGDATD